MSGTRVRVVNGSGECIAWNIRAADTFFSRLAGLAWSVKRQAFVLTPCRAVHTFGTFYSLDIVFLDRDGVIRRSCFGVRPFRCVICRNAITTLEFPEGTVREEFLAVGERLLLLPDDQPPEMTKRNPFFWRNSPHRVTMSP